MRRDMASTIPQQPVSRIDENVKPIDGVQKPNTAPVPAKGLQTRSSRAPLSTLATNTSKPLIAPTTNVEAKNPVGEGAASIMATVAEVDVVAMDLDDIDEVDQAHVGDSLWVAEYISEISAHYFDVENNHRASPTYMDSQPGIRPEMRRILIDWLIEIHTLFGLRDETLYLAVNILDRYLTLEKVDRSKFQLVGCTALMIATKYEESPFPIIENYVYVTDKMFQPEDILRCESMMCNTLGFIFTVPTPFHFAQRFMQVAILDERNTMFAKYLMELVLLEYSFLAYPPSVIAAAAVYLTTYFDAEPWNEDLVHHTTYTYADIRSCVKEMYAQLAGNKPSSVQKKYSSKSRKRVARIGKDIVEAQNRHHQEAAAAAAAATSQ